MSEAEAFAYCEQIAKSHYENFPVGSFFVPKEKRPHFYAIYAFSRIADDFADEAEHDGSRLTHLLDWEDQLTRCFEGQAEHPVFIALRETVNRFDMPQSLFQDLLTAFKMDVTKRRYQNFDEVLFYCQHSANPVGRLVLLLSGYRDAAMHQLSDHICTGLQLANFWQDVAVDLKKDRIYLPRDEQAQFGYTETELKQHIYNQNFIDLMRFQVDRTQGLFDAGKPLLDKVGRDLRLELRLIWHGGTTILRKIEANRYNAFQRPKLGKWDVVKMLGKALFFDRLSG